MSDILNLILKELSSGVREGRFSASEVLEEFAREIERKESKLHAFISIFLEEAKKRTRETKRGGRGKLLGVPLAVKDNIVTRGLRTTAGSKIIENFIPQYDATVVSKLLGEGAIILGKTNMDEFAMGSSTENSAFGPTRNPYDPKRVPGGSSGGSAAAVASRMVPAALGTDTGGSIKQPAAFCGVVGLRPTYGAVSRYGVIALTSSLDQVGPLARTVEDVRYLFSVIRGRDLYDATSWENPNPTEGVEIKNLRVGLPKEYFTSGVEKGITDRIGQVAKFLEGQGVKVEEVSLPHTEYGIAVYYIITPSEVSTNLSRFDGIRFGLQVRQKDVISLVSKSRGTGFGEEPKRRIILGTFALSSGYADKYYLRAARARTLVARDFEQVFKKVDALLTPTAPTTAFKIGEKKDPLSMYMSDIFTIPANLAGLPGLSVPVGDVGGLPVGAQLLGPKFSENTLFSLGEIVEGGTWS
ncbi:Asp-tRNA(Asn)/Glu-tRNA(Gln) amidotransferase subunit GatA [Candidatus Saccharibacteria bacterium]|nr:Asp-tRNA(Asn)/Glu-tRNA(Gln) amidotransferase subunit GatA [Candidatus Saccharibacteria bacterium]